MTIDNAIDTIMNAIRELPNVDNVYNDDIDIIVDIRLINNVVVSLTLSDEPDTLIDLASQLSA